MRNYYYSYYFHYYYYYPNQFLLYVKSIPYVFCKRYTLKSYICQLYNQDYFDVDSWCHV